MIVIVSMRDDRHAIEVAKRIRDRDQGVMVVDAGRFPLTSKATFGMFDGNKTLTLDGQHFAPKVLWLRRWVTPRINMGLPSHVRDLADKQSRAFVIGLSSFLDDTVWVNDPAALAFQDNGAGKMSQIAFAKSCGLKVANTCITNDPDMAKEFVMRNERTICKALVSTRSAAMYTREVLASEDFSPLRNAPQIFQERVEKKVEIRVVMCDAKFMATEIHSGKSENPAALLDWRRDIRVPHLSHNLPNGVALKLYNLQQKLGLRMGVHDLILTPDDKYVYLETNPQGEFMWMQDRTGQDYVGLVANYLVWLSEHGGNVIFGGET